MAAPMMGTAPTQRSSPSRSACSILSTTFRPRSPRGWATCCSASRPGSKARRRRRRRWLWPGPSWRSSAKRGSRRRQSWPAARGLGTSSTRSSQETGQRGTSCGASWPPRGPGARRRRRASGSRSPGLRLRPARGPPTLSAPRRRSFCCGSPPQRRSLSAGRSLQSGAWSRSCGRRRERPARKLRRPGPRPRGCTDGRRRRGIPRAMPST
mmetsp:Transcript_104130/g.310967  ORF Transcript_104130/g.310967 Transcript_104130/m.310967 type:complete len:210 (-) Transcript_104130:350-979(-)